MSSSKELTTSQCWNCTSGNITPNINSNIIFQSLDMTELIRIEDLAVKTVVIRNSTITFYGSSISSTTITVENSRLRLLGSTLSAQDHLSIFLSNTNSRPSFFLYLRTSRISSNTMTIDGGSITFGGEYCTINTTVAHFSNAALYTGSTDIVWDGQIHLSNVTITSSYPTTTSRIIATADNASLAIQHSTIEAAISFKLPVTMNNVTVSYSRDSALSIFNGATITNSMLYSLRYCTRCDVSDSTLYSIPDSSSLHLSGNITILHRFATTGTTISGSHDLHITSLSSVAFRQGTITGPIVWDAEEFTIWDTTITGSCSFIGGGNIQTINSSTSSLTLRGSWRLSDLQARDITADEIVLSSYIISIDVDDMLIERLIISSYGYIQLKNTTLYRLKLVYLQPTQFETRNPIRGGILTRPSELKADSDCSTVVNGSTVSVNTNATGLYVTYVPPTPRISLGYSDGSYTYLRLVNRYAYYYNRRCVDSSLLYHKLVVRGPEGQRNLTQSPLYGYDGDFYVYRLYATPDENDCTRKDINVSLISTGDDVVSSPEVTVPIYPRKIVLSTFYPWGFYNETDFSMAALAEKDAGNILVTWNASRVPEVCGYRPQAISFGGRITPIFHGKATYRAATTSQTYCDVISATVPEVSLLYSRDEDYVFSDRYLPYTGSYRYWVKYLVPVDAYLTPESLELIPEYTSDYYSYTTWKVKDIPNSRCSCGTYSIILTVYNTNGTLFKSTKLSKNDDTIDLSYGTYVLYVTGLCYSSSDTGGYGKTIRLDVDLQKEPPSPLRWIIPVSIVGGMIVFAIIIFAFVLLRRRMRFNYYRLE
ncbi:hypothetical protein PROFUN_10695 [Planoprotostelium fungivorum]|uniref:Uncharacterized protein n=1 Tax=Planoprotostelium fungivorum TaxID=1890364 RepID=A0A2P6N9M9_9EUKA|nr:hypothetical protein PROFUN_10695 [Planoprotostelium fungivorum]